MATSSSEPTVLQWLRANGYGDVVAKILTVLKRRDEAGVKTRRNWWDVLAGTLKGERRSDSGFEFPILAAARRRKGWPSVSGERHNPGEAPPPPVLQTGRWPAKKTAPRAAPKARKASSTSAPRARTRRTDGP